MVSISLLAVLGLFLTACAAGEITVTSAVQTTQVEEAKRLTVNPAIDFVPDWSPDGDVIAFTRVFSESGREDNVYIIDPEGEWEQELFENEAGYLFHRLKWSPDGEKLAFIVGRAGPDLGVFKLAEAAEEPASTFKIQILRKLAGTYSIWGFDWSPDGKQFAIVKDYENSLVSGIFTVNIDDTGLVQVTSNGVSAWDPNWSPDGKHIVFKHLGLFGDYDTFIASKDLNADIYAVNVDGTGLKQLTDHPSDDSDPEWSPRGDEIVFVSERDGNMEIYLMRSDGSGLTRLTNNEADDYSPTWSPDGKQIAFVSERDGNPEIYVMDVPMLEQ